MTDSVQETQGEVAEAISQVKKAREQVLSHGDALENQITHSFDSIAALLQQKKDVLVAHVRELEKADLQDLNGQEKIFVHVLPQMSSNTISQTSWLCESCNGLKISKDEELCDDMKHQINVFNSELIYMRKVGK